MVWSLGQPHNNRKLGVIVPDCLRIFLPLFLEWEFISDCDISSVLIANFYLAIIIGTLDCLTW